MQSLTSQSTSTEEHLDTQSSSTELPALPDLTEQMELSLLSIFDCHDRMPSADDDTSPFSPPLLDVIEVAPDAESPSFEPHAAYDGPLLQIIDWTAAKTVLKQRLDGALPMDVRRIGNVSTLLRDGGSMRRLARIKPAWRTDLNDIEQTFPNFVDVIDYVRAMFALAAHGNGVPMFTPILLAGPPGVGKSYFATHFAEYFGAGFQTVHMETAQTSSVLSGSAEHWGNTKSGMVFNALIEGDYANPVFFLDEIDKAFEGEHDPLMSLYALLEGSTAKSFTDSSYPWLPGIDASRIVWVCTCNDVSAVPDPIVDRMRVFDIAPPTVRQSRQIVLNLMDQLLSGLPEPLRHLKLAKSAIDALSELSPRQAQAALLEAIGTAVYRKKTRVTLNDVPLVSEIGLVSSRIGFLD